ncbi:hypothetical protein Tco_0340209 [Tanacetum coccineum]
MTDGPKLKPLFLQKTPDLAGNNNNLRHSKDLAAPSPKDLFHINPHYKELLQQIGAICGTGDSIYQSFRMTGLVIGEGFGGNNGTTPTTREQIAGYLYAIKSLVKEHNRQSGVSLIRLSFDEDGDTAETHNIVTGGK